MSGKNINYFLMDGFPNGRIKCSIANWTGISYRIPRTELKNCGNIGALKQSGVYFLFDVDDNETGIAYVGQAGIRKNGEGVRLRLKEHHTTPKQGLENWYEAVVFTTSNNSFGPTEISWLENRFCALATAAKRYIVKNSNDPNIGNVTEEKESELEEFVNYAKVVMGVLGHKVFEPLTDLSVMPSGNLSDVESRGTLLYFKRKSKKSGTVIEATCLRTAEGFVVKHGSFIEMIDSDSVPPGIKAKREAAKIDKISAEGVLLEDMLFKSPSYAASFVIGGHTNGTTDWKTAAGKTLKEIEASEVSSI